MKIALKRWAQEKTQCLIVGSIGASLCFFVLMNYITQGSIATTIFFTDVNDNYMDFFHSLIDASCVNPYTERHVIYPPLCYMLYGLFGHLIPADYYVSGSFFIRNTIAGMFSFCCYLFMSLFALYFFTKRYAQKLNVYKPWLIGSLMLSAPMLFTIQRGNFIMLTVACLIAFLCYKDDSSLLKRHFSFLMLAIAANIKIYPAVFGLLLVSEKRWRDCLYCVIYGLALFCLPMMLFGGLSNIPVLIGNILETTDSFGARLGTRIDLGCLLSFLSAKGVFSNLFNALQNTTLLWGTGLLLLCYSFMNTELNRILCLTLICSFIPGFSYMYNLLYLFPLFLIALQQRNQPVLVLILATFIYYPFDASSLPAFQVAGATLLPRLWDIVASFSGVLLICLSLIIALQMLSAKIISRRKVLFQVAKSKQIIFNSHMNV